MNKQALTEQRRDVREGMFRGFPSIAGQAGRLPTPRQGAIYVAAYDWRVPPISGHHQAFHFGSESIIGSDVSGLNPRFPAKENSQQDKANGRLPFVVTNWLTAQV